MDNMLTCPICGGKAYRTALDCKKFFLTSCKGCKLTRTKLTDLISGPSPDLYMSKSEAEKHYLVQREQFADYAREILDFLPNVNRGSLLDVGCGMGWVVKEAGRRGYVAVGIDPSVPYVNLGKRVLKLDLYRKTLEKFRTRQKFDVIVLNHVLEHIKNPRKFLEKIKYLSSKSGLLLVACPNIDSLMFRLFRCKWYGLVPWQHIWQFSDKTLKMLLQANGLEVIKIKKTNLYYKVPGIKGAVFRLLLWFSNIFQSGDQTFILARPNK
ncbi:MAG: class I SAM-dependent methyltransferase [Candidatus Vogelbacteria bacterium]|nr:class I SAM-dependent methyltransferase [Candidatus Vogelbacteria bacterium]